MAEARIQEPIILLGAPRSGTTMLFNVLSGHPDLWSLYREGGAVIERQFPVAMTPGSSDVVEADQVDDAAAEVIRKSFLDSVGNMGSRHLALSNATSIFLRTPLGRRMMKVPGISKLRLATIFSRARHQRKIDTIRMVEKTPENSFRVQLVRRVFPDAMFVYITRDPRPSIASIYTGWTKSTEFRRFRFPPDFKLSQYDARWWSFGLLPGWEYLNGSPVMEVCARQWLLYNQFCRRDLELGNSARTLKVSYEDMVAQPGEVLRRIAGWADLDPAPFKQFERSIPVVNTSTNPQNAKWRKLESELGTVEPLVREEAALMGYKL